MPSPFPGMDPYLEHPSLWPNLHDSLIIALRDALQAELRPRYWVAVEEWVYVAETTLRAGRPDMAVAEADSFPPPARTGGGTATLPRTVDVVLPVPETVRETYLEIREPTGRREVITVVEVLSPTNKRYDREAYLAKRTRVLGTRASLVELYQLRAGARMPAESWSADLDYGILVARGRDRPRGELIGFSVRDPVPAFPVPLRESEEEPQLSLGELLAQVYDRGAFDLVIDYAGPPDPPLTGADALWADDLLSSKGLRAA